MELEVLISTMNERIYDVEFNPNFNYVVCHQISETFNSEDASTFINELSKDLNITYYQMKEFGLSRSRNKAIELSKADLIWIMDDDTKLIDTSRKEITEYFSSNDIDFISVMHYMGERLIYKAKNNKSINLVNAAKVSSINMVLNRSCINSNVRFDTRFGLGTELPSGEEYIFMTDLIKKGLKGRFTNIKGSLHLPEFSSGNDFYSIRKLVMAKLYMFQRVFPKTYWLWITLFFSKKINKTIRNYKVIMLALNDFRYKVKSD